jgi:hypothetical protein
MIRFVYIASPYTKGDVAVNVRTSLAAADAIAGAGFVVFAPLLTHFWHMMHPRPWDFWVKQDLAWIERCDAVVRLPGESVGADKEVARAGELGLPVFFGLRSFMYANAEHHPMCGDPLGCHPDCLANV